LKLFNFIYFNSPALTPKVTSGKKLLQCRERVFKQERFQFSLENVRARYFLNCMAQAVPNFGPTWEKQRSPNFNRVVSGSWRWVLADLRETRSEISNRLNNILIVLRCASAGILFQTFTKKEKKTEGFINNSTSYISCAIETNSCKYLDGTTVNGLSVPIFRQCVIYY